jgi:hypothetical protein
LPRLASLPAKGPRKVINIWHYSAYAAPRVQFDRCERQEDCPERKKALKKAQRAPFPWRFENKTLILLKNHQPSTA